MHLRAGARDVERRCASEDVRTLLPCLRLTPYIIAFFFPFLPYRIAKVYETESYDYPTQISESMESLTHSVSAGWSSFASHNLKNTKLPAALTPSEDSKAPLPPKTLAHAISRAAKEGAAHVGTGGGEGENRLGKALNIYGTAMEKVSG